MPTSSLWHTECLLHSRMPISLFTDYKLPLRVPASHLASWISPRKAIVMQGLGGGVKGGSILADSTISRSISKTLPLLLSSAVLQLPSWGFLVQGFSGLREWVELSNGGMSQTGMVLGSKEESVGLKGGRNMQYLWSEWLEVTGCGQTKQFGCYGISSFFCYFRWSFGFKIGHNGNVFS